MIRFVLALVAVLALAVTAEAGGFRFRNPPPPRFVSPPRFVQPQHFDPVVRGSARDFNGNVRGFDRFVTVFDRRGNEITTDRVTGAKFVNGVRVR